MVSYKDDDDEKKSKKGRKVKDAKKSNLTALWIVIGVVVAIFCFLIIFTFFTHRDDGETQKIFYPQGVNVVSSNDDDEFYTDVKETSTRKRGNTEEYEKDFWNSDETKIIDTG